MNDEQKSFCERFVDITDLSLVPCEYGAWFESEAEIDRGLAWGQRKAFLLTWLHAHMGDIITQCEREYIELHYFRGMTCREIAAAKHRNPSTISRVMKSAVLKLRSAVRNFDDYRVETSTKGKATRRRIKRSATHRRRGQALRRADRAGRRSSRS